jgi:hypothetical protein
MAKKEIEWQTLEHAYYEKTSNWYWIVGITGGTLTILFFIFGNPTLALVLLVGTLSVLLHGARVPNLVKVSLEDRGIRIGSQFYPYANLTAFSIDEKANPPVLVLDSSAFLVPNMHILLEETNPDEVRDYLLDHLNERYHEPSFVEGLIHYLGF